MDPDLIILTQAMGGAVVAAIATVYIGTRQMISRAKTEITAAEIQDKSKFRSQLMERINTLHEELQVCKQEHTAANARIERLEKVLRDHGIEVVNL